MGVKSNSPQEIYFGSFDSTEGSGIGLDPIPPDPFTATGGTITTPGPYCWSANHFFLSSVLGIKSYKLEFIVLK